MTRHYDVFFTPEAEKDLLELYEYIAEHSSADRALNYIERIEEWSNSLETFPERGIVRNDIRPGLRVVSFDRRVSIAICVDDSRVFILRLLYAGRELTRAFE